MSTILSNDLKPEVGEVYTVYDPRNRYCPHYDVLVLKTKKRKALCLYKKETLYVDEDETITHDVIRWIKNKYFIMKDEDD